MAICRKASKSKVIGEPAADKSDRRLKVERLFLGDREYVLYRNRE
jgi:hypothetical protein